MKRNISIMLLNNPSKRIKIETPPPNKIINTNKKVDINDIPNEIWDTIFGIIISSYLDKEKIFILDEFKWLYSYKRICKRFYEILSRLIDRRISFENRYEITFFTSDTFITKNNLPNKVYDAHTKNFSFNEWFMKLKEYIDVNAEIESAGIEYKLYVKIIIDGSKIYSLYFHECEQYKDNDNITKLNLRNGEYLILDGIVDPRILNIIQSNINKIGNDELYNFMERVDFYHGLSSPILRITIHNENIFRILNRSEKYLFIHNNLNSTEYSNINDIISGLLTTYHTYEESYYTKTELGDTKIRINWDIEGSLCDRHILADKFITFICDNSTENTYLKKIWVTFSYSITCSEKIKCIGDIHCDLGCSIKYKTKNENEHFDNLWFSIGKERNKTKNSFDEFTHNMHSEISKIFYELLYIHLDPFKIISYLKETYKETYKRKL